MGEWGRSFVEFLKGAWYVLGLAGAFLANPLLVATASGLYHGPDIPLTEEQGRIAIGLAMFGAMFVWFHQQRVAFTRSHDEPRIDALERRLRPRRLTADQRVRIEAIARRDVGFVHIEQDLSCSDGARYAKDFLECFTNAGWQVSQGMVGGPEGTPSGLCLFFADPDNLNPQQQTVVDALRGAGISFDTGPLKQADPRFNVTTWFLITPPEAP